MNAVSRKKTLREREQKLAQVELAIEDAFMEDALAEQERENEWWARAEPWMCEVGSILAWNGELTPERLEEALEREGRKRVRLLEEFERYREILTGGMRNFRPHMLISSIMDRVEEYPWLPDALRELGEGSGCGGAYIQYVVGDEWQCETNILFDHGCFGMVVMDILTGNRVGGIEFIDLIPARDEDGIEETVRYRLEHNCSWGYMAVI